DAEAVAPVNVRHRQAGMLNARQEGDVGDLLGRLIGADQLDEFFTGEDQPVNAHAMPIPLGDSPEVFVDLFERSAEIALAHESILRLRVRLSLPILPRLRVGLPKYRRSLLLPNCRRPAGARTGRDR